MTIWITRDTAGSIYSGGLERLRVHFTKPIYLIEPITDRERDTAFYFHSESRGYYKHFGWHSDGLPTLSVGKWIGYAEDDNPEKELALYIWDKVCEHFLNEPFDNWCLLEREGRAKIEDFLLEIDINLVLCLNPKSNADVVPS